MGSCEPGSREAVFASCGEAAAGRSRGAGCSGPGVRGASGRGSAWLPVHGFLDPEDLGRGRAAAAWPGGGTLEGVRVRNLVTRGAGGAQPRRDG